MIMFGMVTDGAGDAGALTGIGRGTWTKEIGGTTGAGVGHTGAGVGHIGTGIGYTGAGVGHTGVGVGHTGIGVGHTGGGVGHMGIGHPQSTGFASDSIKHWK